MVAFLVGFNPYRVFKFVATLPHLRPEHTILVSIPIGFSSSLQLMPFRVIHAITTMFQSLSGFQVRCNKDGRIDCWFNINVSIPIGFSSSLQRRIVYDIYRRRTKFQSLSGFQVRCNSNGIESVMESLLSFNPYRVFKFVATIGEIDRSNDTTYGFNPYRVFKFVATLCTGVMIIT